MLNQKARFIDTKNMVETLLWLFQYNLAHRFTIHCTTNQQQQFIRRFGWE
uniref:Uncharacterized protein n=2 Tax=Vibrio TaxID=662 RepID=A0A0H3ZV16_9VIBR|nr:hypothetical protein [Vibrio splendidus]AKN40223.1 hypothetical protein [Vibrio tasmaniensis]